VDRHSYSLCERENAMMVIVKIKNKQKIVSNVVMYIVVLGLAFFVATSDWFQYYVLQLAPIAIIAELFAGGLYTSLITIPVSISLFSVLAEQGNTLFIVLVGAAGATIGDFIIMNVFRKASQKVRTKSKKWKGL